ncbi:hypothetical protein PNOK_0394400 [Pyrrhoderma noxium]|uniref:Uncharacterized protein n=1 Tax=Pyrrhoderma noxium TaxID=2282107 RepID=A0A286UNZ0_9AGAM|nr:hypothetical protein PNOK_0394400 [Pyrrhoderma noxium]
MQLIYVHLFLTASQLVCMSVYALPIRRNENGVTKTYDENLFRSKFVYIDNLHIEIGNIGVLDIIKLNQNDLPTSITFSQADKDTVTVTSFSEPSPKVTPGTPTTYQCGVNATCPELNEVMTVTNVADIPTETDYIAVINNYRISRFNPTDAAVSQISNPSAPESPSSQRGPADKIFQTPFSIPLYTSPMFNNFLHL